MLPRDCGFAYVGLYGNILGFMHFAGSSHRLRLFLFGAGLGSVQNAPVDTLKGSP